MELNYLNASGKSAVTGNPPLKEILNAIQAFEQNLEEHQEIALKLGGFGQSLTMFAEEIQCINDNMILFKGVSPHGEACTLIQHISQVNFILAAVPKSRDAETARRIQFIV
ncbi:DUF6173 family protein [Massilioclostridium coli]|uniref:DUF6173 family protein n=1 Tax=Massilioclostridium coli TaxID=1870991 RepID=UPI0022E548EE|nr:DUF6173 family protein [Massilioclostridium coli]